MNILSRLTGLLSKSGRGEDSLQQAMKTAKDGHPAEAIAIYTRLIDSKGHTADLRARALFNRALAYSSLKDDERAEADLAQVLTVPNLAENVQIAARSQLARVRKRTERRA
jgi:tetratricopeptide (TPR) repeat protein